MTNDAQPQQQPLAWRYEAATLRIWENGIPTGWDGWEWKISGFEPNMGDAMRNVTPLYAAQPPAAPVETGCVCQDQHRKGHCTEAGCPNAAPVETGDGYIPFEGRRGAYARLSAESRRDEIAAGAFYKTRGDKNNLPHIVGPLEHADDGDAPWKASVYDQVWKWGYDGLANADGSPHNRDLVERVYRPAPIPNEPQGSSAGSDLEERVVEAITEWVGETPPEHALAAAREAIAIVRGEPQEVSQPLADALDWLINCVECEVNVPRTTTVFQLRLAQAKEALALSRPKAG